MTRKTSFIAALSVGEWPLAWTARPIPVPTVSKSNQATESQLSVVSRPRNQPSSRQSNARRQPYRVIHLTMAATSRCQNI